MQLRLSMSTIGRFLFGQGLLVAIQLAVGLAIVRILPLSEYALYISASFLIALISTGSDMGLSQGVNSLGARIHNDKLLLSTLVTSALRYRKFFYVIASATVVVVGNYMLQNKQWPLTRICLVISLVLAIGLTQSSISIKKSILNIKHDDRALFKVGFSEALIRLVTVWVCFFSATAECALLTNLFGSIASRMAITKACDHLLIRSVGISKDQSQQLRDFVIPLLPAVIYFILQNQISIFLLNLYGYSDSVAEVGALGRLGQIISLLMMLNPFLIQPFFARLENRKHFLLWSAVVVITLVVVSILLISSAYLLSNWWLFIIGTNYSGLTRELPLVLSGSAISLAGATIYTLLVSRNYTRGQIWTVYSGSGLQMAFLAMHGINTTNDALILNLLPSISYLFIQILILAWIVLTWPSKI